MPSGDPVLRMDKVAMTFAAESGPDRAVLRGVDLELGRAQSVALVGRSGSGKSTLLHLAAGIAVPSSGRIELAGRILTDLDESARTRLRRETVGLVFQFFHLLPHLNVHENIALAGWVAQRPTRELDERIGALLERVGLADRAGDPVGKLSGGEMQRIALCRALVNQPRLLLADEPTGSLDDQTGRQVLELLLQISRQDGCALLYVTHSLDLAAAADRVLVLQDGVLAPGDRLSS